MREGEWGEEEAGEMSREEVREGVREAETRVEGEARVVGEGVQLPSNEALIAIKSCSVSRGNFAKKVISALLPRGVLAKCNCRGKLLANTKRSEVAAILAQLLEYNVHKKHGSYGVLPQDRKKCYREVVQAIDSHCRQLVILRAYFQTAGHQC